MKRKILVVDDEPDILLLMQTSLEKAGYTVLTASNGCDAITQAKAEQPDLILMDVMMPQMDGFETTRSLKADDMTAGIPIVMLTALNKYPDMEKSWDAGSDLYLSKPFKSAELIEYIRCILED